MCSENNVVCSLYTARLSWLGVCNTIALIPLYPCSHGNLIPTVALISVVILFPLIASSAVFVTFSDDCHQGKYHDYQPKRNSFHSGQNVMLQVKCSWNLDTPTITIPFPQWTLSVGGHYTVSIGCDRVMITIWSQNQTLPRLTRIVWKWVYPTNVA